MTMPDLTLDLEDIPPPPSPKVLAFLPILGRSIPQCVEVFFNDLPVDTPTTPPRESGFVTTVEWPLRPGDTRIAAYHIGSDRDRKSWFLWEFTMNDLHPFVPKYLEKKPIAKIARQGLSKRDAAVLLLKAVWEYERDEWEWGAFFWVSSSGCLDSTATYAIAATVWEPADESE